MQSKAVTSSLIALATKYAMNGNLAEARTLIAAIGTSKIIVIEVNNSICRKSA